MYKLKILFLPENKRLVYYLAAEEYLSEHGSEEYFFVWRSRPTVIFGRHQVMQNEVNIPYCEAHGIEMYRRKSGGGCVYSDEGNLMLSYIVRSEHSQEVFARYLELVCRALRSLGLPAVSSSHNDVMVGERKVSGNACHLTPGGTIVHGTLLLSSNIEVLQQAITPSAEKLAKHGVQSVRQRVATLSELGQTDVDAILQALFRSFCPDAYEATTLTEEELYAIEAIEQEYLNPDFIEGK